MTKEKSKSVFLSAFRIWSSRVGKEPQRSEDLNSQSKPSTKFEEVATPGEMHDVFLGGSTQLLANSDKSENA